jgi:hypothetical protein
VSEMAPQVSSLKRNKVFHDFFFFFSNIAHWKISLKTSNSLLLPMNSSNGGIKHFLGIFDKKFGSIIGC